MKDTKCLFPGWVPLSERELVDFTGSPIERFVRMTNRERQDAYNKVYVPIGTSHISTLPRRKNQGFVKKRS